MNVIRGETVRDYAAIANVHVRAFNERPGEALIVALHRQRPVFDPELSLVAEIDGRIVGHVLFSPHTVLLMGEAVAAVNLSPIAVDPAHQRRGIGGNLLNAGHDLARRKGYAFSFLLGHPSYYPRFGYRPHAYGEASLTLATAGLPAPALTARRPAAADVPALLALWQGAESAVDFALEPGRHLLDWLSPNPAIEATVFAHGESVVGYARVHRAEVEKPRVFLAQSAEVARQMAAHLAHEPRLSQLVLPLHPATRDSGQLGQAVARAWQAAMVCPLRPSAFDRYYAEISAGRRRPGRPIWPPEFDFD